MAMSTEHKKTLDRTLVVLAEDMDVLPAIIHLKSKGILTELDEERINAKTTEQAKVMELIKLTKKRGKKAFQILKEYIQNCQGSEHLADELETNLRDVEAELQGLTLERDGTMPIDKWNEFEKKFHYFSCDYESIGGYEHVPDKLNILLIGKTGSGKSATGNTITGKPHFKASGSTASETKTIDMKEIQEGRFRITVIDTPGLFDTANDFQNDDLVLEIAKTMITFEGGIHLFLLVCNATTRFTEEDKKATEVIERILTKNVYKNCVVILTNARAKFGTKDKGSLRDYVIHETQQGGHFADIIMGVNNRIVAVENCFDDEFLTEKHRQRLLCCLAQVIHDNRGSVYSNNVLEKARKRFEQQDTDRKNRIAREKELTVMRNQLRNFLVQEYLNKLTEKQLDNISSNIMNKDTLYITTNSGVKQLPCITTKDVKAYLRSFIQENDVLIANLKDMKMHESKQRREYEQRRKQLKKKEEINKMQSIILPLVSNQLKTLSKQELETINENKKLPQAITDVVMAGLQSCNINVENEHIVNYMKEVFIQYIDDKVLSESLLKKAEQLRLVQRDQRIHVTMETLKEQLPKAMEDKTDNELHRLYNDLENVGFPDLVNWKTLFDELVGHHIEDSDITISEISQSYLHQNCNWLQSFLSTIFEKRKKQRVAKERQKRENIRNSAFFAISEVIKDNLKLYLTGMTTSELEALHAQIEGMEVPEDIFRRVTAHMTVAQKSSLSDMEIQNEIIEQIKERNELIEQCKKEAGGCFAGSTEVRTKDGDICKISNVKIDDEILVYGENGHLFYDKIYLISHASEEENSFIRLQTSSGKELFVSSGHLLPVDNLYTNVAAKDVVLGGVIFTLQNDGVLTSDNVTAISYDICRGAYCPMTMNGTIVVNDVAASCYTTFFPSRLAHNLLSPIRLLFNYLPLPLFKKLLPYDEKEGMPLLLLTCRSMITTWRALTWNFNPSV